VQSSYIPWKGYFDMIRAVGTFVLYDDVQYTRRDWRNRNRIKTPHGTQWLDDPRGGEREIPTEDQRYAHQRFRLGALPLAHLTGAYGKAPFFRDLKARFERFYLGDILSLAQRGQTASLSPSFAIY